MLKRFENFEYKSGGDVLKYDAKWKLPDSPIRQMIEREISDILLELVDIGYTFHIVGYTASKYDRTPYIWLVKKKNGLRVQLDYDEIEETILRIEDFLKMNGFETSRHILNEGRPREQLYINFDLKEDSIKEKFEWRKPESPIRQMIEKEISDILLELVDMGYAFRIMGYILGPHVWLMKMENGRVVKFDYNEEVEYAVKRVEDFLKMNGFETSVSILKKGLYINFDLKENTIKESLTSSNTINEEVIKERLQHAFDLSKSYSIELGDFKDGNLYFSIIEYNENSAYLVELSHDFYDISTMNDFINYKKILDEIEICLQEIKSAYNPSYIGFTENSNSKISIIIKP